MSPIDSSVGQNPTLALELDGMVLRHNHSFAVGIAVLLLFLISVSGSAVHAEGVQDRGYRIGLTPVMLIDRTSFLKDWQHYFEARLGVSVSFIQRQTYREVVDLLLAGELDAAWLCGYPYVVHRQEVELLSVPLFHGEPIYQSYLIVPAGDKQTQSLLDLKQKVFAYSDPDSNSGYLFPQVRLINEGIQPRHFFAKSFFTWSHREVVKAVAEGVAHGGAVDGYVWETLALNEPELTQRTRVVAKSPSFGFPPLVVKQHLDASRVKRLRQAFLGMADDEEGSMLLKKLNLDGFVRGNDGLFDSIADSVRILEASGETR
ncbi:MAG: phosphate/phosphite/phosphonate ABC transporter substrate-binding protein [Candidatus Thiodiazotropha sp.]